MGACVRVCVCVCTFELTLSRDLGKTMVLRDGFHFVFLGKASLKASCGTSSHRENQHKSAVHIIKCSIISTILSLSNEPWHVISNNVAF